ncbi:hypothetical protein GTS_47340 [Gandjariella thermophila]|uniref:Metalloprotease n=1 Tax=Gandjariella thermophila TaxID=1931992 RepID=A0A4D4J8V9_9PSEU|nr:hypothetical protein GTS_47340 [Gandjariella thermophila]
MGLCAVVLIGAALAGLAGLATAAHHQAADPGRPIFRPTAETSPVPQEPSSAPSGSASGAPGAVARPSRGTPSATTDPAPAEPTPVPATADNPLFVGDHELPAVTCVLPRWRSDPATARAFFEAALPCLNRAWEPVLRAANLPFNEPKLAFPTGREWHSACGSGTAEEWAAFYCGADDTVYLPFDGLQTEQYGARPGIYLSVLAHEYGHHVQRLAGVLGAAHDQRDDAGPDTVEGLRISRRIELQADCFAGMFWAAAAGRGSVSRTMLDEAVRDGAARGDDNGIAASADHGSGAHVQSWILQGARRNRTAECNTWKAPDGWVS